MKKLIAILLCCVMLLPTLMACNKGSGNETPTTQKPVVTTQKSEKTTTVKEVPTTGLPVDVVKIFKADLPKYSIVIPAGASNELKAKVEDLQRGIEKSYGTIVKLVTDDVSKSMFEILIGETNREESKALIDELKFYDFGYRLMESKLVIAGSNEQGTIAALTRFDLNNVITVNKTDAFYSSDRDKTFTNGVYRHGMIQINGVDISNYTIVYPQSDAKFESQLAKKLQLAIADACGIYPNAGSDSAIAASDDSYEILIGVTNREGAQAATDTTGTITVTENKVFLSGTNAGGNAAAVTAFIEGFEVEGEGSKSTFDYQLESKTVPLFSEDGKLSTMSFNVYVGSNADLNLPGPAGRKESVIATIMDYLPDTVGLQEASPTWYSYIKTELSDYYTIVGFGRESSGVNFENGTASNNNGEATFILFAKDKFDLVKTRTYWLSDQPEVPESMYEEMGQQYLRVVTWAELTRKSDNKTFVHFNTHLDFDVEIQKKEVLQIVKYMKEYLDAGVPMLFTGDLNMNYNKNPAAFGYLKAMKLVDTQAVADLVPDSQSGVGKVIDYVFASDTFEVPFSTFISRTYYNQKPSDHEPVYSELRF